jgi:alpha-galactosidase
LADGSRAVILLNRGTSPQNITVHWTDLGYPDSLTAQLRDLWKANDLGRVKDSYTAEVASHGVVMLTVKP